MKSEEELKKMFSECKSEAEAWELIDNHEDIRLSIIDNYNKKLEAIKDEDPFLAEINFVIPAFKFKLDDKEDLKRVVSIVSILCCSYGIHPYVDYNACYIYV